MKRSILLITSIVLIIAVTVAYVNYAKNRNMNQVVANTTTTPASTLVNTSRVSSENTGTTMQPINYSRELVEDKSILKSFNSYSELAEYLKETLGNRHVDVFVGIPTIAYIGTPTLTVTATANPPVTGPTQGVQEPGKGVDVEASYSKTNVQVSGVDEADIVKTDGEYIYIARGDQVYVIKAYPPDQLKITSIIRIEGNHSLGETNSTRDMIVERNINVRGLYVRGDKLIIIAEEHSYKILPLPEEVTIPVQVPKERANNTSINITTTTVTVTTPPPPAPSTPVPVIIPSIGFEKTITLVYNIDNRSNPELVYNISISGDYITSRMIDNYLYVLTVMPAKIYDYRENKYNILVPEINDEKISVDKIYYIANNTPVNPTYTTILALDVDSGKYNGQAIIQDYTSHIYMSKNNLYILVEKDHNYDAMLRSILEKILPRLSGELAKKVEEILSNNTSISPFMLDELSEKLWQWFNSLPRDGKVEVIKEVYDVIAREYYTIETNIYKLAVKDLELKLVAVGKVPGRILDQFAMDEYKDYFRVATTSMKPVLVNTTYTPYIDIEFNPVNNVYILDGNLEVVGKLEGIAPSEQIYSARFMGDILFLVTYRRIDPLFAINLSDPENPEIIGYVKIPGYSEYLHPYKNNLLIGIGIETDENGRPLGLKISVFNATDLKDIKEASTIVLKDDYIASPILYDHHAFVLNYEKNYMLIPIYRVMGSGIYMIIIDPDTGKLAVKGYIPLSYPERALYIGDYIYAMGYDKLVVSDGNLREVGSIDLVGVE